MKKGILTLTLSLVLALLMLPITAMADSLFVSSPEDFQAPTVDNVSFAGGAGGGELILTSYQHRDTLPPELLQQMDAAANSIRNADHVTNLAEGISEAAKAAGVADVNNLAVSDLFDLRATVDDWGTATVTLHSKAFENFVALLHYTNGGWQVVDKVKEENDTMTFTVSDFSPFAVVVSTEKTPSSPQTSDSMLPQVLLSTAVLFGAAGICTLLKTRKSKG